MGLFSGYKVTDGLSGTSGGIKNFGGNLAKAWNRPGTEGLSDAERRALDQANADEDARRQRLSEGMRRRARVALGVQGGERSLLFSGYTGTPQGAAAAPANTALGGSTPTGAA